MDNPRLHEDLRAINESLKNIVKELKKQTLLMDQDMNPIRYLSDELNETTFENEEARTNDQCGKV